MVCRTPTENRNRSNRSNTLAPHCTVRTSPMGTTQSHPQTEPHVPLIRFRVLVIGRANAGKTTILQRVCETTESPIIDRGRMTVRNSSTFLRVISYCGQVTLEPSMDVSDNGTLSSVASKHEASEASIVSTTRLCSPITKVMFSTILRESRRVMKRDSSS